MITPLVSRLTGCTCWKVLINNNLTNSFLNSMIAILLLFATVITVLLLPWLLLVVGLPLSGCTCAVAPLSNDSGRFVFSIDSNISAFLLLLSLSVFVTLIVSQVLPSIIPQA